MEKAIKKAIEGGWKPRGVHMGIIDNGWSSLENMMSLVPWQEICLDPFFWQALSKSCGWGQNRVNHDIYKMKDGICCECLDKGEYKCYFCKFTFCEEHSQTHFGSKNTQLPNCMGGKGEMTSSWVYHWHRFIDHLAEGKDANEFFDNLLK